MKIRSLLLLFAALAAAVLAWSVQADDEFLEAEFEFEDLEEAEEEVVAQQEESHAGVPGADAPHEGKVQPQTYQGPQPLVRRGMLGGITAVEVTLGIGVAAYLMVYYWGSKTNAAIADAWLQRHGGLLKSQFAEVGIGGDNGVWMRDSAAEWRLFMSGRRNCLGALVTLQLRRRQDLFSWIMALVGGAWEDTVTVEIPVDEGALQPFVLAVLPSHRSKILHRQAADLRDYGRVMNEETLRRSVPGWQAGNFDVVTDADEVAGQLLTAPFVAAVASHGGRRLGKGLSAPTPSDKKTPSAQTGMLVMAHITDRAPMGTVGTGHLSHSAVRFQLRLPVSSFGKAVFFPGVKSSGVAGVAPGSLADCMGQLVGLTSLALETLDRAVAVRLSPISKKRAQKARAAHAAAARKEKQASKEEEAQRRKDERRAREEERRRNMSDQSKAAKLEAKARKKEKSGARMKVKRVG